MGTQHGAGKHGHKDTKEPYPHHESASTRGRGEQQQGSQTGSRQRTTRQAEGSDLKSREYRDQGGNIPHHTRTSQQMKDRE